jgi:MOSC domain-containing protein YiiM
LPFGCHGPASLTGGGLRNPCQQIETFRESLLSKILVKTVDGKLLRKTGVMGIVHASGPVSIGDEVNVILPAKPHIGLARV